MSDEDLVKRLRTSWDTQRSIMLQTDAWMSERHLAADRIEALTAERDRYRKALEGLMVHEPDYSDTLWQDAREALNGETP